LGRAGIPVLLFVAFPAHLHHLHPSAASAKVIVEEVRFPDLLGFAATRRPRVDFELDGRARAAFGFGERYL